MNQTSYLIFISIYLVFWNRGRRKHMKNMEEVFVKRKGRQLSEKTKADMTIQQKLDDTKLKEPKPYPYDITKLTYLSLESVVKTMFFSILLFLVMMLFSGTVSSLSLVSTEGSIGLAKMGNFKDMVQSGIQEVGGKMVSQFTTMFEQKDASVYISNDKEPVGLSVIIEGCFNFGPLFKGLLVSTILAGVYSNVIHAYRENLYNVDSLRLHITMLSIMHAVFFVGVYTYFTFKESESSESNDL